MAKKRSKDIVVMGQLVERISNGAKEIYIVARVSSNQYALINMFGNRWNNPVPGLNIGNHYNCYVSLRDLIGDCQEYTRKCLKEFKPIVGKRRITVGYDEWDK